MWCWKQTLILTIHGGLLIAMSILNSVTQAAEPPSDNLTGRQLFQHEWKWIGPALTRNMQAASLEEGTRLTQPDQSLAAVRKRAKSGELDPGDGLGPLHNGTSCAECHVAGGGSGVKHNVTLITIDPRSEIVKQTIGEDKVLLEFFPGLLAPNGVLIFDTVVHDRSTRDGYAAIRNRLAEHVPGGIDDAWFVPQKRDVAAIARQPVVAGRYGSLDYYLSQRNSPALFGLGVIDAIGIDRVHRLAARQAVESNGKITGRVAGKFGWRGQIQTLASFVAGACAGELGLNQEMIRQAGDPADRKYVSLGRDMTQFQLDKLSRYVAAIPRPVESPVAGHSFDDLLRGEGIFHAIGCESCHAADALRVSGLFSDLLLHDMGTRLQSPSPASIGGLVGVPTIKAPQLGPPLRNRMANQGSYFGSISPLHPNPPAPYPIDRPEQPQFPRGDVPTSVYEPTSGATATWDSLQREWRTPPLWGVADTAPYLHDGRAETLEEAIAWHGGEADSSRDAYKQLSPSDRDLVLAFLSSLRAPTIETLRSTPKIQPSK